MRTILDTGIVLTILRLILPPFHPLKYKWIDWRYGKQSDTTWPTVG